MPILDRPAILAASLVYLLATLAIGWWAFRRTRDARDFFIAGQGLGVIVTGIATMAAAFSGFVFLGGPGLTYRIGLGSLFICASTGFTAGLLCWAVGKRLRLLAEVREVYTLPDALLHRFGSRRAGGLAAAAVLVGMMGYLGAQVQALGVLGEAIFGIRGLLAPWGLADWSLPVAMGAGLALVLAYTVAGGMVAGVYTDLFQGAVMMVAAVAVFLRALAVAGGPAGIGRAIAESPRFGPAFLDPFGTVPAATALGFFLVFGVGVLGQPHMLHKFFMLKDPRDLKWMPLVLSGSQVLCLSLWLGIGLAVPALVASGRLPPLAHPDEATPAFLLAFAPDALAGLVFAGALAAIMSTASSFLNIAAAALVRDLPRAFGRRLSRELHWGRWATVAFGLAAALFAYLYDDLIALLGTFAFGTFGAALGPVLAVGLNWKRVSARAASASIGTGLLGSLLLELLARQRLLPWLPNPLPSGVLPAAVALAASLTVLFAVTVASGRSAAAALPPDVEAVLDA